MLLRRRVSKKIKSLRQEKKISQQELARRSGYSYQYVNKLETSPSNLSLDAIERLAKALDVDPGEIVSRAGLLKSQTGVSSKYLKKPWKTSLKKRTRSLRIRVGIMLYCQ